MSTKVTLVSTHVKSQTMSLPSDTMEDWLSPVRTAMTYGMTPMGFESYCQPRSPLLAWFELLSSFLDPTLGYVAASNSGKLPSTMVILKANMTEIQLGCTFSFDPLALNPSIAWRMQRLPVDIDELTVEPLYGLPKGSVRTSFPANKSVLTIAVNKNSECIVGKVTCILKYQILKRVFRKASTNNVEIRYETDVSRSAALRAYTLFCVYSFMLTFFS